MPWVSIVQEEHHPNGILPSNTKKVFQWIENLSKKSTIQMVNYLVIGKKGFFCGENLRLLKSFKTLSITHVQNGQTCIFWQDNWLEEPLKDEYPKLFSFTKSKTISVHKFYAKAPSGIFPVLSAEALNQLQEVQSILQHFSWAH